MSSPSTTGPMRFNNAGPAMPATSIGSVAGPLMMRFVGAAVAAADPLPADAEAVPLAAAEAVSPASSGSDGTSDPALSGTDCRGSVVEGGVVEHRVQVRRRTAPSASC